MKTILEKITRAVEKAAKCPALHMESIPVIETFRGKTVWEGVVESFALTGNEKAMTA